MVIASIWTAPIFIDGWYDKSTGARYSPLINQYKGYLSFSDGENVIRELTISCSPTTKWRFYCAGMLIAYGIGNDIMYKDPFPIVNNITFIITATEMFYIDYKSAYYKHYNCKCWTFQMNNYIFNVIDNHSVHKIDISDQI